MDDVFAAENVSVSNTCIAVIRETVARLVNTEILGINSKRSILVEMQSQMVL